MFQANMRHACSMLKPSFCKSFQENMHVFQANMCRAIQVQILVFQGFNRMFQENMRYGR